MQNIFAIIESDAIISLDLQGTLKSIFENASILFFDNIEAADKFLSAENKIDILFANARFTGPESLSALARMVEQKTKVIILGEAQSIALPAAVIDLPFTTNMILEAIKNAVTDLPAIPPANHT